MTVTEEKVGSSEIELPAAAPLIRALKNALVCASTETHIPAICSVQFLFDGQCLELRSTDRYLALFEQVGVELEKGKPALPPWQFLLPRASGTQVLTFLKSVDKRHPVSVTWEPATDQAWAAGSVRLSSYDSSVMLAALDAQPPTLRALVPKDRVPTEVTGFRRSIIQGIGKIEAEAKDPIVRVTLAGSAKCQRVDWPDERRTLLVMSARITEDASDWGVPGL